MSNHLNPSTLLFPLISFLGLYTVSSLFLNTGHYALFRTLQPSNPYIFPDGTTLQTFYTGLPPLDSYLTNLQLIITPVIDGSSLKLALLGLHFGNVLFAVFTVMLMEAVVEGRLVAFALSGLAVQYCGYFVTMPMYCYVQLVAADKRTVKASRRGLEAAVRVVLISMVGGFVLPSVVMCLPFLSRQARQFAVAFWQNFPIWVGLVQVAGQSIQGWRCSANVDGHRSGAAGDETLRKAVTRTYKIAMVVVTVVHVGASLPIVAASLFPDELSTETVFALHWRNFLIPPRWTDTAQISGIADGAWNFLRYDYYIGTFAALIWAAMACYDAWRRAVGKRAMGMGVFEGVVWMLVGGPGALLLFLMSIREVYLSEEISELERNKIAGGSR